MIENGADVNAVNNFGDTALMKVVNNGQRGVLKSTLLGVILLDKKIIQTKAS